MSTTTKSKANGKTKAKSRATRAEPKSKATGESTAKTRSARAESNRRNAKKYRAHECSGKCLRSIQRAQARHDRPVTGAAG